MSLLDSRECLSLGAGSARRRLKSLVRRTFQTTGCAASVAARFVSTVERESLDFQARYVADWNRELLWAGGVLARTVYEEELAGELPAIVGDEQ